VTRVPTNPADPPGSTGQVRHPDDRAEADGHDQQSAVGTATKTDDTTRLHRVDLVEPSGPVERFMSGLIRKLAWSRLSQPKVALTVSGLGLLLGMLVGALAPDAETLQLRLPLSQILPKLFHLPFPAHYGLHDVIAASALYSGDILACLGLGGMLWAYSQGWRPDPRKLFLVSAGIVAIMVNLTPIGSSDTASYAAYGRIAALGYSPYSTSTFKTLKHVLSTPSGSPHVSFFSVLGWLWKAQPSVYGPVATWLQTFAGHLGGGSVEHTIWALMIINGLVFLGVGLFLLKTSDDPVRATLFWTANPVLILELVGGGHFDTLIAAAAIGAIQVARRMPNIRGDLLAGLLIGLGFGIKISMGLVAIGLAWPLLQRREWMRVARMAVVAMATVAIEYSFYGVDSLKPMFGGSEWVSWPSPLRGLQLIGETLGVSKGSLALLITLIWLPAMFIVAWLVYQRISADQPGELVAPFALSFAWIVVAPWMFAWYTALPWVIMAQVPRNRMTRWLAIVTVILALAHSSGGWVPPGHV
jgi:hypothetical protein